MALLTWIKLSLFLVLMLQGTGNGAANPTTQSTSVTSPPTTKNNGTSEITITSRGTNTIRPVDLLRCIIVSASLAALIISVVTVSMWMRNKGNKTQINENMPLSSNPAQPQSGPEACQDRTEPDDAAPYASVCFTKKTGSTAQVQTTDEGNGEAAELTYSTVKVSTSPPGASTDPNDLYATVNKPKRQ